MDHSQVAFESFFTEITRQLYIMGRTLEVPTEVPFSFGITHTSVRTAKS